MKMWQLWEEGYRVTGESSGARSLGEWPGETFVDACNAWDKATNKASGPYYSIGDDGIPRYWGCRIFDNEDDARASFG